MSQMPAGRPAIYGKPMKAIAVRLPAYMIAWLKEEAEREDLSVAEIIRDALEHCFPDSPRKV